MSIQQLFDLMRSTQYQYFDGNFFRTDMTDNVSDKTNLQIYFSTGNNGRGNAISVESCINNLFDLSVYIIDTEVQEFNGITEEEVFQKIREFTNQ
jgi:hypothetical protein